MFPASVTNPMEKITKSQLKIIDFNHSRMFTLDDSPFIRRKEKINERKSLTEDELWQEMIDLPSPARWRTVTDGFGHIPSNMASANAVEENGGSQEAEGGDTMSEKKLAFSK